MLKALLLIASKEGAARAGAPSRARVVLLLNVFADFAYDLVEDCLNVDVILGGGLEERATEGLRHLLSFFARHLPFRFQVTLAPHNDQRNLVLVLDTEDALTERVDRVEGGSGGDGVCENEALALAHEIIIGGRVLFLAFSTSNDVKSAQPVIE